MQYNTRGIIRQNETTIFSLIKYIGTKNGQIYKLKPCNDFERNETTKRRIYIRGKYSFYLFLISFPTNRRKNDTRYTQLPANIKRFVNLIIFHGLL